MSNIVKPTKWWGDRHPPTNPPEPPDPPTMELHARVTKLEAASEKASERLSAIETRLTRIETRLDAFATREDLHKAINDQTWKIVGAMITLGTLLSGIVFFIARNVR